jgi:tetratricopeptide (TPR) repeat protein
LWIVTNPPWHIDAVGGRSHHQSLFQGETGHIAPGSILLTISTPDGTGGLRVLIEGQRDSARQRLWATSTTALDGTSSASFDTLRLANSVIEAVGDAIFLRQTIDQRTEASLLARLAVRKIFSLRPGDLEEADRLLRQACEMDERGLFLAWRAQLRVIQSIELHGVDPSQLLMEAEDQCYRALELEPNNSMVLATVSNARLALNRNILSSVELAKRSVEMNPGNPLAWDSLANASLHGGDTQTAHQLAAVARRLGNSSPMTFWWDMGLCLTAVVSGKQDQATLLAERSAAMSPHFRPPLRYLTALYAADGREEDARHTAATLRRLEPDFSFDRLAHDPAYPTQLLRKSPLFAADRIAALHGWPLRVGARCRGGIRGPGPAAQLPPVVTAPAATATGGTGRGASASNSASPAASQPGIAKPSVSTDGAAPATRRSACPASSRPQVASVTGASTIISPKAVPAGAL